tara:strand:- start:219 stop:758 length:540 start_codon:yes stop_codon:yes gene_type:complete
MAIDRTGKVTTTGLMGGSPKMPKAPDMSNLTPPASAQASPRAITEKPAPVENQNLESKINNLTDEDKVALETVLSPSIVNILKKIAPEISPLLDQAGSNEENVVLPVSIVKNYAIKRYGGADEAEAVQNFITDLSGEQPDNNNVPPGAAEGSQGMMAQQSPPETETSGVNFDQIDQGLA